MGGGGEQRRADHAGERAVGFLQAWIELFEAQAFAFEKAIEVDAFPGEVLFDLLLHRIGMRTGQHCFIGEVDCIHGIEPGELQVIARPSSPLGEEFVEEKLHHQESGTEIKPIFAKTNLCIASTDYILLFENLNLESALRQEHGSSEPARSCSHDGNALLFAVPSVIIHSSMLGRLREEMVQVESMKGN